ncbi:MAG: sialate O-acetylesterase, partial [Pirellulaceae bacterium]|nr:sialate O-acetylesterase [Pirellulaceae bacterium]
MKSTLGIFVLLGIMLSAAPADAATKVFLLGGQSNMAGVGQYPGGVVNGKTIPPEPAIPAPYDDPQPDVQFWHNNAWTDLRPGFGFQSGEFGPEVTFGYRLNQLFPDDDIYLVKYAESGSNLAVQWKPDGTGAQYNAFKSRVNSALLNLNNAHLNPEVAGMIWMQGESDANKHEYAVHYAENLAALIDKVRLDFDAADMRFVIGRIDDWPWGATADCDLVRAAQQTVAEADDNAA